MERRGARRGETSDVDLVWEDHIEILMVQMMRQASLQGSRYKVTSVTQNSIEGTPTYSVMSIH